ncbi:MAG: transporter [Methylococcus sp.]|nr:MAG: transporter [Methylococcus sp.]
MCPLRFQKQLDCGWIFFLLIFGIHTEAAWADEYSEPSKAAQGQEADDPGLEARVEKLEAINKKSYAIFREYGRRLGQDMLKEAGYHERLNIREAGGFYASLVDYAQALSKDDQTAFFKGRYDRSRARLPENIERWRSEPDIGNPGADLANWPNSAFTLPQGRVYIEFEPLSFSSAVAVGTPQPVQYSMDYLLRYGLTDNIELRLFGNGPTYTGGSTNSWNFSPLGFDTKIHCWGEQKDIFLPAMGIEAFLQTEWLGNTTTNSGTQPGVSFNFDQSLPFEIDFEYNLGAVRTQDVTSNQKNNVWGFSFQWSLQRDFWDKNLAWFIHGYYNAPSLPRVPNTQGVKSATGTVVGEQQNVVGAGLIWTINSRVSMWGQTSAGTNASTPSMLSNMGFAVAF